MKLVEVDASSWQITGSTFLRAFPRVLAITPDEKKVYQTIRWLNGALVVDPAKKTVVDRIALGEPMFAVEGKDAHGLAITADGSELWITTQTTNSVTILDVESHEVLGRIRVGKNPNWIGFTPDGKLAVVSNTSSQSVTIINVAARAVVGTVEVGASPKRLVVGRVVVTR